MLKLVSSHIQAHLNAFLQILEYFSQICLGPLARESPCTSSPVSLLATIYIIYNIYMYIHTHTVCYSVAACVHSFVTDLYLYIFLFCDVTVPRTSPQSAGRGVKPTGPNLFVLRY